MATPLLSAMKRDYPDCLIYWLVDAHYAAALAGNPLVDEVIAFDTGRWRRLMRRANIARYIAESMSLRRRLQRLRLDAVINLHGDKWWTAWFLTAGARVGVFYSPKIGVLGRLYTNTVAQQQKPKRLHNSEHYLGALNVIGICPPYDLTMLASVTENDRRDAERFLRQDTAYRPDRPLLVLHPGTSRPSKNWLPEQYAALTERFPDYEIVITGSAGERELALTIADCARPRHVRIAAGELGGLGSAAALIERADAVITGDTAALHLASALGAPLVGIYGSTRPRSNAPLFGISELLYDDAVPCAPCYLPKCPLLGSETMRCMKAVSPAQVAAAVQRVMNTKQASCDGGEVSAYETTQVQQP